MILEFDLFERYSKRFWKVTHWEFFTFDRFLHILYLHIDFDKTVKDFTSFLSYLEEKKEIVVCEFQFRSDK